MKKELFFVFLIFQETKAVSTASKAPIETNKLVICPLVSLVLSLIICAITQTIPVNINDLIIIIPPILPREQLLGLIFFD